MSIPEGIKKANPLIRFSLGGVMIGFFMGIYEGGFVLVRQRHLRFNEFPAGPAILLLAPLVNALAYGLLGAILGSIAALARRRFPGGTRYLIGIGLAIVGTQWAYRP